VSSEPKLVYVGYVIRDGRSRLVVLAGTEAINSGVSASDVVKEVSKSISGSGEERKDSDREEEKHHKLQTS